jgi:hypothetical protein
MRKVAIAISLAAGAAVCGAARADSTWSSINDKCQVTTPSGWKQGPAGKGAVVSPDGKSDIWVDGGDLPFDAFQQYVKPSIKPAKVLKETKSYYAAELKPNGNKRALYIIMARGKAATCRVELHYDVKDDAVARKIGDSLKIK